MEYYNKVMTSRIYRVYACLLLAMFLPTAAWSEADNNYFSLGVSAQDFGYKEFNDQDVLLDREDGPIAGLVMEFGKEWTAYSGVLRFELMDGVIEYDGQTQGGTPLTTRSEERIINMEALIRHKLDTKSQLEKTLIAGFGYREWRRTIRPTNITIGLTEIYRWPYLTLGGAATLWRSGLRSVGVDARWLRPIHPSMAVDLAGYDGVSLALGAKNSARLSFPMRLASKPQQRWTITPYWESWRLGRSADRVLTSGGVATTSTAHEPRSETNVFGITLTLQMRP